MGDFTVITHSSFYYASCRNYYCENSERRSRIKTNKKHLPLRESCTKKARHRPHYPASNKADQPPSFSQRTPMMSYKDDNQVSSGGDGYCGSIHHNKFPRGPSSGIIYPSPPPPTASATIIGNSNAAPPQPWNNQPTPIPDTHMTTQLASSSDNHVDVSLAALIAHPPHDGDDRQSLRNSPLRLSKGTHVEEPYGHEYAQALTFVPMGEENDE
jgi:hypothetical protein